MSAPAPDQFSDLIESVEHQIVVAERVVCHVWHQLMLLPHVISMQDMRVVLHYEGCRSWSHYYTIYIRQNGYVYSQVHGQSYGNYKGSADTPENLKSLTKNIARYVMGKL